MTTGSATRSYHAYVAEVEMRASRAEQDREDEANRRVAEERLRIARELHDAVGHHVALINVQAGALACLSTTRTWSRPGSRSRTFSGLARKPWRSCG